MYIESKRSNETGFLDVVAGKNQFKVVVCSSGGEGMGREMMNGSGATKESNKCHRLWGDSEAERDPHMATVAVFDCRRQCR